MCSFVYFDGLGRGCRADWQCVDAWGGSEVLGGACDITACMQIYCIRSMGSVGQDFVWGGTIRLRWISCENSVIVRKVVKHA